MSVISFVCAGQMNSAITFPAFENGHEVRLVGSPLDRDIIDGLKKDNFHITLKRTLHDGIKYYQIEELEEVLEGKATSIKGKDYLPTRGYIEPFLERVQKLTSDIRVHVKLPDQITYNKNGDIDTADLTFNRVWLEAVLPNEYQYANHQQVIGMVYGLDTRKAVVKMYSGAVNSACTNLCVFNPDSLVVNEIEPETPINFKPITKIGRAHV